jgi:hypothetical protein
MSPTPLQVTGRSPKPKDWSPEVCRPEQDTGLDEHKFLLMPSQEVNTNEYSNDADPNEENSRIDSARDIYNKPVRSSGDENPPDIVSDRE